MDDDKRKSANGTSYHVRCHDVQSSVEHTMAAMSGIAQSDRPTEETRTGAAMSGIAQRGESGEWEVVAVCLEW